MLREVVGFFRNRAAETGDRWSTVPALFVTSTMQGCFLPATGTHAARPLERPELELLARLARPDAPPLADLLRAFGRARSGALMAFVDELRQRGLIVAAGVASSTEGRERSDPTSADPPVTHDEQMVFTTPTILRLGRAGYEVLDHDGRIRALLSAAELAALGGFRRPATFGEAWIAYARERTADDLTQAGFEALLRRAKGAGLVQSFGPADPTSERAFSREARDLRRAVALQATVRRVMGGVLEKHQKEEEERRRGVLTGVRRLAVVPVHFQWQIYPLALGMIIAHAKALDGGRLGDLLDIHPSWLTDPERDVVQGDAQVVYLFSHYIWSREPNLAMSARVKAANRWAVTIHGGPDVPKYIGDVETYFRTHRHVDVTVRGEGEVTAAEALAALAALDREGPLDLSVLESVAGLSFRLGDRVVHTPDRPRVERIDDLPSPYLSGVFDVYGEVAIEAAVIETNRGCPYACTFCDWGSATASKIRQFSLERVFAEIEWCARSRVQVIAVADANFGIFERDVAIAEKLAAVKKQYGFPHHFGVNYAKNSVKYLRPIVKTLGNAGVLAFGQLSLQSMDAGTLKTIKRSNIKVEKYHELASEFRDAGLPLFIDLMMGLPGSTVDSFRNDLQQTCDREVIAKVYPTQMLINSPMNEPSYREMHGIEAAPGEIVSSCATFTRDDYEHMKWLRRVYMLCEKYGVLRQVARYVRQETGVREIDFFERLATEARAHPERWPLMSFTLDVVPGVMVPPGRWRFFLDEVRRYLVEVLGLADDGALDTVIDVQEALLPARHRTFPHTVTLTHDYAAWHRAMLAAKDDGHYDDWPDVVPRLREFAPGSFTVTDTHDVCGMGIGHTVDSDSFGAWEIDSPVSRPVTPLHDVLT